MEIATGGENAHEQLRSLFNDTGDDDEFLGFSDSESRSNDGIRTNCSNPVELESISQDSNSKSSGYSSASDNDLSSDSDDLSDSEDESVNKTKREQALKERRGILKNLMSDLHNDSVFMQMMTKTPKQSQISRAPKRTPRTHTVYSTRSLPPVTRRRSKLGDPNYCPEEEEEQEEEGYSPRSRLLVRFKPKRKRSSDSDEEFRPKRRTCSKMAQEHIIVPVEEVTDQMLANIAQHSVGKEYNAIHGTSCHQCRQKTMDTKSCCRSKECVGVRGQFCGPCLKNRYGESVREALLNPDWVCPVCRGFCNCSICRNRNGKCATGILIGLAKFHGFTNVKDYLASLKSEKSFIEED